jgi:dTDP-glucose pyrophosphorylase
MQLLAQPIEVVVEAGVLDILVVLLQQEPLAVQALSFFATPVQFNISLAAQ